MEEYWTVEEVEQTYIKYPDNIVTKNPFDPHHDKWLRFKEALQPGDLIQTFCGPPETYQDPDGFCGLCIVRDGKIVRYLAMITDKAK